MQSNNRVISSDRANQVLIKFDKMLLMGESVGWSRTWSSLGGFFREMCGADWSGVCVLGSCLLIEFI